MTVKKRDLKKQSLTDRKRIDSMKDEEIDLSDIPELGDNFFKNAELVLPKPKVVVTLRVDADVMEWFRNKGKGYQTMMNAVLKGWVEQHRT
ncbi:MAG: BrnA antitoxin family protein [Proteobacteria bacterium]|nr:BrnA antitoxin family protein [Pseudomonadota bacterium]MBU1745114.1 BrnA antitoxin family protein [Pseudomonadota bacterium]MBU1965083.1 BrnA antitoxin family protein [Pseudomonadota bacterium]MBU4372073.1 BrnA antitoxin family protein [Pseudomonadota bacterium]MBU4583040.1 BrnA antitoxin family protein [Pseudomonadota bacterium]